MNDTIETRVIGGHELPFHADTTALGQPLDIPGERMRLKNRLVVQPLEGCDSTANGAPGPLTRYRYRRFLESGAGLVWVESVAVQEDGRSNPHALWIHDGNVDAYKAFVDELKADYPDVPLIAQLTHAGRFAAPHGAHAPVISQFNPHHDARIPLPPDYPVVSDDYLERASAAFVHAAELCAQAGFDGVDVKACHGYLLSEQLSCRSRAGRFGGSFENRARLLLQTVQGIKAQHGADLLVASRICHADTLPFPYGFGMAEDGSLDYDLTEPLRLVAALHENGVNLVNVSVGRPTVNPAYWGAGANASDTAPAIPVDTREDHFNRFYQGTRALAQAFPDICFVGSGYTLLRQDAPQVAAGVLASSQASLVGFGRMALANPRFASEAIEGHFNEKNLCTLCGNCYKLLRAFAPTGCPTRDREVYLPHLRQVLERAAG